jgi:hypothetical protein
MVFEESHRRNYEPHHGETAQVSRKEMSRETTYLRDASNFFTEVVNNRSTLKKESRKKLGRSRRESTKQIHPLF